MKYGETRGMRNGVAKSYLRLVWQVCVICVAFTLVLAVIVRIWFPSIPEYSSYCVWAFLRGAHTEYPPEFSPLEWDRIHIGMSEDELYSRIGKPLLRGPNSTLETWGYPKRELTFVFCRWGNSNEFVVWECLFLDPNMSGSEKEYINRSGSEIIEIFGQPESINIHAGLVSLWYSTPKGGLGEGDYIHFTVFIDPQSKTVRDKSMSYYVD